MKHGPISRVLLATLPLLCASTAGCGQSPKVGDLPDMTSAVNPLPDMTVPPPLLDMTVFQNVVNGMIGGAAFGTPMTGWIIGQPDAPTTTVVYLFNKAVDCHDPKIGFGAMGWDSNLPDQTQFLEIKMIGPTPATTPPTMPGDYRVTKSLTPGPGEATCNHSLSHAGAASVEVSAQTGTVTLSTIVDSKSATGSFRLSFSGGSLNGTFNAGYCDIGVEP